MFSVSERGTPAAKWDKDTWAPLEDLARNKPEAGVHFQGLSCSQIQQPVLIMR